MLKGSYRAGGIAVEDLDEAAGEVGPRRVVAVATVNLGEGGLLLEEDGFGLLYGARAGFLASIAARCICIEMASAGSGPCARSNSAAASL